jgi:hypothetical protein
VEAASFHDLAEGVARGGAPRARIAVYKTLWGPAATGASTAALLAAIDDAIHDGVDVLSLSLSEFYENSFGALHAVQKGITVVYAGGNDGPRPQTIANTSPWAITVAASKVDRSFPTVITLGNKQQIVVSTYRINEKRKLVAPPKNHKRVYIHIPEQTLPISFLQGQSLYYQVKNSTKSSFIGLIVAVQ